MGWHFSREGVIWPLGVLGLHPVCWGWCLVRACPGRRGWGPGPGGIRRVSSAHLKRRKLGGEN